MVFNEILKGIGGDDNVARESPATTRAKGTYISLNNIRHLPFCIVWMDRVYSQSQWISHGMLYLKNENGDEVVNCAWGITTGNVTSISLDGTTLKINFNTAIMPSTVSATTIYCFYKTDE